MVGSGGLGVSLPGGRTWLQVGIVVEDKDPMDHDWSLGCPRTVAMATAFSQSPGNRFEGAVIR